MLKYLRSGEFEATALTISLFSSPYDQPYQSINDIFCKFKFPKISKSNDLEFFDGFKYRDFKLCKLEIGENTSSSEPENILLCYILKSVNSRILNSYN